MKIILSPAKKMITDTETLAYTDLPVNLTRTKEILSWLRSRTHNELRTLWGCSDKIAEQNFERLEHMELASDLDAMDIFAEMSENDQQDWIDGARRMNTKDEMRNYVHSITDHKNKRS